MDYNAKKQTKAAVIPQNNPKFIDVSGLRLKDVSESFSQMYIKPRYSRDERLDFNVIRRYPPEWQTGIAVALINRIGGVWNQDEQDSDIDFLNKDILGTINRRISGIVKISKELPENCQKKIMQVASHCVAELKKSILKSKKHDDLCNGILERMAKIISLLSADNCHPNFEKCRIDNAVLHEELRKIMSVTDVGICMLRRQVDVITDKRKIVRALEKLVSAMSESTKRHLP